MRNLISIREKVILALFFQDKFYNAVFIYLFFMNLQRQNVTNVTVTYVFETTALKPLNVLSNSSKLYHIFKVNCQILCKIILQNMTASLYKVCTSICFFIDIWWNSDCTRFRKDGMICEGNFIYTKVSKPLELISFLFGNENLIINNLLNVKKLSFFATYITTKFYIFGKQT